MIVLQETFVNIIDVIFQKNKYAIAIFVLPIKIGRLIILYIKYIRLILMIGRIGRIDRCD